MTFLYGTNLELLYSLPAIGATQSASAATILNTAATAPPFQLPALQNIWSPSSMAGKGLMIMAAGGFDIGANTLTTLKLSLDPTVTTTSVNIVAEAGALAMGALTTWAWEAQVWLSCVGVTGNTASSWYASGQLTIGAGNNEATTAITLMWGQPAISAGIPTAISLPLQTPYFPNLISQWSANPTAMVCTQFMVFGLN
jgi:hypothetical protein